MDFPVSCRLLFIMAISMLQISAYAQSQGNITLRSFLAADSYNLTWNSSSGEFAFGFRKVSSEKKGYLLAIMFNKGPDRTIVWSANRDRLVEEGSIIQFFADDRFELHDTEANLIWAANFTGSHVAYCAMLDNGNFVLAGKNSAVMWQSFDHPTDTLLPGQVLNQNGSLFASFSQTNYSRGRFKFIMQTDGNLVLYTLNYPMADHMSAYWSTQNTLHDGYQLIFNNQSGHIYVTAKNGTVLNTISSRNATSQFHQRLTLDYDGVLRHYVYRNSTNSTAGRLMAWSVSNFEPSNICLRIGGLSGEGACGFNSVCSLGTDQRPKCSCPLRYSLMDPTDRMSGCKPDFVQQSCGRKNSTSGYFHFTDMPNTDWLNSEYYYFESVNEQTCRESCGGDCFCHAAVFRDGHCWKMGFPLRNGRIDINKGGKSMVKIAKE